MKNIALTAATLSVSLSLVACAASPDAESAPVEVELSEPTLGSLALDVACYNDCMEARTGGDPIFNGESTHDNPNGINPNWGAGTYRQTDACYQACSMATGRSTTKRRATKLPK